MLMENKEQPLSSNESEIFSSQGSLLMERPEEYEKNRRGFLKWVEQFYRPQKIYYPGSGFDRLPKAVFGENRVTHLSLEETGKVLLKGDKRKKVGGYFSKLGSGKKVEGDFLHSPFKDESFDMVLVHDTPFDATEGGLVEFWRVLRAGGVLVLDNSGWDDKQLQRFFGILRLLPEFLEQELPKEFNNPEKLLAFVGDASPFGGVNGSIVASEGEIQDMLKKIPQHRQFVVRQFFAVFKKEIDLDTINASQAQTANTQKSP